MPTASATDCTAIPRSLLAQFGLTPKSKRGLGASEAGDAM